MNCQNIIPFSPGTTVQHSYREFAQSTIIWMLWLALPFLTLGMLEITGNSAEPHAHTLPPSVMLDNIALNGMGDPNGSPSVCWFEWGGRGDYERSTDIINVPVTNSVTYLTARISSLAGRETYRCRLVVSNADGVAYGPPQMFTTGWKASAFGSNDFGQLQLPSGLTNAVALTAGAGHSLALKADGTVLAWGQDDYKQAHVPAGLQYVVAVAAGSEHSLALLTNGLVVGWGANGFGQLDPPLGLSNVVAISAGGEHSLALRSDGTMAAWGRNDYGYGSVPEGISNVVAIACGFFHNLVLRSDGTVYAWGYNTYGEPRTPVGLSNVIAIAAGTWHNLAATRDGNVWMWGNDGVSRPVPSNATNVLFVSAGGSRCSALRAEGTLTVWETDDPQNTNVPVGLTNLVVAATGERHTVVIGPNLPPVARPTHVTGSANHDLVISLSSFDPNGDSLQFQITTLPALGKLYQFLGVGNRGSLISLPNSWLEDFGGRAIFVPETNDLGPNYATFEFLVSDGEAPSSTSAAVTVDIACRPTASTLKPSDVRSTGATLHGMAVASGLQSVAWFEWGFQGGLDRNTPSQEIGNGTSVVYLSAPITGLVSGSALTCRLVVSNFNRVVRGNLQRFTTGMKLRAWGRNDFGQAAPPLGLGRIVGVSGSLTYYSAWSDEGKHSIALREDGSVVAWGNNGWGQTNVPAGVSNVMAIAAGGTHCLALRHDGFVTAWGGNSDGQTDVPPGLSNVIDVAAGALHSIALRKDGTAIAWGYGGDTLAGISNIVGIAAGQLNSVALLNDGRIVGLDELITNAVVVSGNYAVRGDGQVVQLTGDVTQVMPGQANIITVSEGQNHALALSQDGAVNAWGNSFYGQANVPADVHDAVAIGAGTDHSLAVARNVPPQVQDQNPRCVADRDLVISLGGKDANNDLLRWRITSLPQLGTLYQYNGGGRGAPMETPSTWITDSGGRFIFAPGIRRFEGAYDTFTFVANDGENDSAIATITPFLTGAGDAITSTATDVRADRATLNGCLNPGGFPTWAWFNWRTKTGISGATAPINVGSGTNLIRFTQSLLGLEAGLQYFCRLVVSNQSGLTFGSETVLGFGRGLIEWGANDQNQTSAPVWHADMVQVTSGASHNVALRGDNTVGAWGGNLYGQVNTPRGLTNIITVAGGWYHNLALRRDTTVVAWGDNSAGNTNVPPGLTNVIAIAAGAAHSLALRADGTIWVWGQSSPVTYQIPVGLKNVAKIAVGANHALALKLDGTVVAWGDNSSGQTAVPVNLTDVLDIACGSYHSLAIRHDGTVIAWGLNRSGQASVPAGLSNVISVAAGDAYSLGLTRNLDVVAWGTNDFGQLNVPTSLTNVVSLATGLKHVVALVAEPLLPCVVTAAATPSGSREVQLNGFLMPNSRPTKAWFEWGVDTNNFLKTPSTNLSASLDFLHMRVPTAGWTPGIPYLYRIVASNQVGVAYGATRRFGTGRRILAWGEAVGGQTNVPSHLRDLIGISTGGRQCEALGGDGTVRSWGYSSPIIEGSNIVALANGNTHGLALLSDGTLHTWGAPFGWSATPPEGLGTVIAIAAGVNHSMALLADGTVQAWGFNYQGQTNVPSELNHVVAMAGGFGHSVALRVDGSVIAWGTIGYYAPSVPRNLGRLVAISAGDYYSAAVRDDGTVVQWSSGPITEVEGMTNITDVTCGWGHNLALRDDGKVLAWGDNSFGRAAVPASATNVVSIGAGNWHSLALAANASPSAISEVAFGLVNHDLALQLRAADLDGDPLSLRIATLPSGGLLYQYEEGRRGAAITQAGTIVSDPSGNVIFAPTSDQQGSPYAIFSFVANDGIGVSWPASVTVNVFRLVETSSISGGFRPSGAFNMLFQGRTQYSYSVWASTNLVGWDYLGRAIEEAPGEFVFQDFFATNWSRRFYRIGNIGNDQ